jgi:uncharacterized membrane protein YczE
VPTVISTDAAARRRYGVLLVGFTFVATGVASMIRSQVGVAPYDVVTTGLHERFGMPIGAAAVLLPILFAAIGLGLGGRGRLGIGTVLATVIVGPLLGLVLHLLPEVEAMVPRLGYFVVGFGVLTLGIVLVIVPDLGAGPAEVLMLAVADRGSPLARARTGIEVACVAAGWALGGEVGFGTIAFAVLIGPALRRTLTWVGYDHEQAAVRSDTAAPGA